MACALSQSAFFNGSFSKTRNSLLLDNTSICKKKNMQNINVEHENKFLFTLSSSQGNVNNRKDL